MVDFHSVVVITSSSHILDSYENGRLRTTFVRMILYINASNEKHI